MSGPASRLGAKFPKGNFAPGREPDLTRVRLTTSLCRAEGGGTFDRVKKTLPAVFSAELPAVSAELCAQVEEIEACALRGILAAVRPRADYSAWIDEALWTQLGWPEANELLAACPKREEWIECCLRRFRRSLQPPTARFPARSVSGVNEVVDCALADGDEVRLRYDQVAYQRNWGVEIQAETARTDRRIAAYCLNAALVRLRSDWTSVNRWCRMWPQQARFLQTVSFSEDRLGNRFEQLVLGILNEEAAVAVATSLYEDVHDWTDIILPRLGPFRRVCIQTKFLRRIAQHDDEVGRHLRGRQVIVVSPVEIARFLEARFGQETVSREWAELLDLFPVKPCDLDDLASEIYWFFNELLEKPSRHPFDPVQSVPVIIREAVRGLVWTKAADFAAEESSNPPTVTEEREA